MMELAIEVMRGSVHEHRPEGSLCPSVGAVLVRPDGSVETGARGELRFDVGLPADASNALASSYAKVTLYVDAEQAH